ncbi:HECTD1 [Symbiodinium sp. CCMP2592]|nr:HECTD1 [Symbiodinium sp. CCMP2592]
MAKRAKRGPSEQNDPAGDNCDSDCDEIDVKDVTLQFASGDESVGSSQMLCAASPVFRRMYRSGMAEVRTRRVSVNGVISEENVLAIAGLGDYYQVKFVTDACVEVAWEAPFSVVIQLLLAELLQRNEDAERCAQFLALEGTPEDLEQLEEKRAAAALKKVATIMRQLLQPIVLKAPVPGLLVRRGPDWQYPDDADEVLGQRVGKTRGQASPGWVVVQWIASGRQSTYRAGADDKYDLVVIAVDADYQAEHRTSRR